MLASAESAFSQNVVATSADVSSVLEMFTSQGCSSCPPADRLLGDYARRDGVVALAYHVDYWDYIGWKDVYGTRQNTERQRAYGAALQSRSIYTPQMIINGQREVVGSHKRAIEGAMQDTKLAPQGEKTSIRLTHDGTTMQVYAEMVKPQRPRTGELVLILVTFRDEAITLVDNGENQGLELVNTNMVRDWRVLGTVTEKPVEVNIPISLLQGPEGEKVGYAALLQTMTGEGKLGPIVAAAVLVS
ncbi:DUF1223 domain-containing protein [Jiella sp. 40Bstr34]|uniref:DUF1223 domain-containing protein n=2 Tax=Jiella pacifica TaxID=2696469 RepID=A0A6N9T987_9HYPH|nr:DUF1223 domain-containing protein [Jiella pacifica]